MTRRKMGRPTKIDQPLDYGAGTTTVSERILGMLRQGNYLETAAAAAGVHKDTVYEWLKIGAAAATKLHRHEKLTAHERRCWDFADAVGRAQSQAEVDDVVALDGLAQGRVRQVTVVKVNAEGVELERSERVELDGPDASVLQWRLERRFPDRWGRKRLELTGADGGPIGVDLGASARDLLASELDRMAARLVAAPDPPPPGVAPPEEPDEAAAN